MKSLKVAILAIFMMLGMTVSNNVFAAVPSYTYTGTSTTEEDGTYWYIYLKSDGTLTLTEGTNIDIFLVGGGAGGGAGKGMYPGAGGDGGATITYKNIEINMEKNAIITIGTGGSGGIYGGASATEGTASIFNIAGTIYTTEDIYLSYEHSGGYWPTSQGNYTDVPPGDGAPAFDDYSYDTYGYGGYSGMKQSSSDRNGYDASENTGGGGDGGSRYGAGGAGGSGVIIIRGCISHVGGTHDNGGTCTTCSYVYQTHSQSGTISSYTQTTTQHTPNYACSVSGCTSTYAGTAENHSGGTHPDGICTTCSYVYQTHSQTSTISSYTTTETQHTPNYACSVSGCTTTYAGTTENHSGATHPTGTCSTCSYVYETHSQSATIVDYNKTATQHTPIYACSFSGCASTYTGTAVSHSGETHANGGTCTTCGQVYKTHSKSGIIVSYAPEESTHTYIYACSLSGCTTTYEGEKEAHTRTTSCDICGWRNAGVGYYLRLDNGNVRIIVTVIVDELVNIGYEDYAAAIYTINEGHVTLQNDGNRREFVMPGEDVSITIQKQ